MKFIGYIATSVDGFIARNDGGLDWLEREEWADPDGSDYGFKSFMSSLDAMIMGKNTFLKILDIGQWIYGDLPVFVASNSLRDSEIPEHLKTKVSLINGSATEMAAQLKSRGKTSVYIDGGKLLQSFIREGVLDELIVTKMPILIGSGIPLFGDLGADVKVNHISTDTYKSGVTQSRYGFK